MPRKNIVITPYNPDWPKAFEKEAAKIKEALADNCIVVHHIGSTSVPGLIAKPVIDIIAVVKQSKETIPLLENVGFQHKGEYNIPNRIFLSRPDEFEIHLNIYEEEHPEIELNLLFRDYLRSHPEARDEYAQLKEDLLKEKSSYEKNGMMFTGYGLGKDAFIRKILQAAHFNRVRIVKCAHYAEWEAAKKFAHNLDTSVGHVHLILYQGVEIAGYAHLQILPEKALIHQLLIDPPFRQQGLGAKFLQLCEKWVKKPIQATNPCQFLMKHGYT